MLIIYSYCSYSNGAPSAFTIKMAKLSLQSIRNMTSYKTKLYVDELSLPYFEHLGYDEVEVTEFNMDGIDKRYWNASKLWVYAQQSDQFLHVDFDTCFLDTFKIPEVGDIITEKLRTVDISKGYKFHAIESSPDIDTIVCSGLIGGVSYGNIFKEHYDWARDRMLITTGDVTYEMLNSVEEYSLTQRIIKDSLNITGLDTNTFLHFWCNSDCGLTKEEAYREVVDGLLEFHSSILNSEL